jgi:hypothetical protein
MFMVEPMLVQIMRKPNADGPNPAPMSGMPHANLVAFAFLEMTNHLKHAKLASKYKPGMPTTIQPPT